MLRAIPLLILPIAAYFILDIIVFPGEIGANGQAQPNSTGMAMSHVLLQFTLISERAVTLTVKDALILGGLAFLFLEMMKATHGGTRTILDHFLSMLVFVGSLLAFLLLESAGTATFLILTAMTFLDVIAGFSITIRSVQRDISVS